LEVKTPDLLSQADVAPLNFPIDIRFLFAYPGSGLKLLSPRMEAPMTISQTLLPEFDEEMAKTRRILERVPADRGDFAPHPKSMPLRNLAPHVAQLTGFGLTILTTPHLDFSAASYTPLPFESAAQLVQVLDGDAPKVRQALINTRDEAWSEHWKLLFEAKPIFEGSRFLAYREMFLNHVIHHRAQLGVYLRLNGIAVPGLYGPSADEPWTP
jgi:uncharacterized damage-inducible protein DinB